MLLNIILTLFGILAVVAVSVAVVNVYREQAQHEARMSAFRAEMMASIKASEENIAIITASEQGTSPILKRHTR